MAIYIDRAQIFDIENLDGHVLSYLVRKHQNGIKRLQTLKDAYLGKNAPHIDSDDPAAVFDYPRYIVDTVLGYYLGDPVKYTLDDSAPDKERYIITDGEVKRVNDTLAPESDITPVLSAYRHQSINDIDTQIGKDLGIYGEAYELLYASTDANPLPKSTVCDPRHSFMVRDTTTDHNKLFFITYEERENLDGTTYTVLYVYTDKTITSYRCSDTSLPASFTLLEKDAHFFGEVPAVEYSNNSDRLGDFETTLSVINRYNKLMNDRLLDKEKFVDAILALFGFTLEEDGYKQLQDSKLIDAIPTDARIEYIQKTFDEAGVQVLADALKKDIHKLSMVVDMSDEAFGTASGQALKMKLLTMTMLVKNKMKSLEKGLKKRFEMYNFWLTTKGEMSYVDRDSITPVFTTALPVDEAGIVNLITQLDGFVDRETLLSQLWFIKDPKAAAEKAKLEAMEKQEQFLDTFGIKGKKEENTVTDDEEDGAVD